VNWREGQGGTLRVQRYAWPGPQGPLVEAAPHHSGPEHVSGKYFVYTGNTTYGVQNLEYDDFLRRWFMGVYLGTKPTFPNYGLFAVDAATRPVLGELVGTGGDQGLLIALAKDGRTDETTGIRGWVQKADVGMEALGDGLFYLSRDSSRNGLQTSDITLYRWIGGTGAPFAPVNSEAELNRAPVITSQAPAGGRIGQAYSHTFTAWHSRRRASRSPRASCPWGSRLTARPACSRARR
jgi:hypothetical protein